MPFYVETRDEGRARDYRFLGAAPEDAWWSEYGRLTEFEGPSMLVTGESGTWRCYFTGIPSNRRDSTGTTIRFSIAGEGRVDDAVGVDLLVRLASSWLQDRTVDSSLARLDAALNLLFPRQFVAAVYGSRDPSAAKAAEQKLLEAFSLLVAPAATSSATDSWVGNRSSSEARAALANRCRQIGEGLDGAAFVLNAASQHDCESIRERHKTLAVLLADGPDPPKALAGTPAQSTVDVSPPGKGKLPATNYRAAIAGSCVVLLLLMLLILLV